MNPQPPIALTRHLFKVNLYNITRASFAYSFFQVGKRSLECQRCPQMRKMAMMLCQPSQQGCQGLKSHQSNLVRFLPSFKTRILMVFL